MTNSGWISPSTVYLVVASKKRSPLTTNSGGNPAQYRALSGSVPTRVSANESRSNLLARARAKRVSERVTYLAIGGEPQNRGCPFGVALQSSQKGVPSPKTHQESPQTPTLENTLQSLASDWQLFKALELPNPSNLKLALIPQSTKVFVRTQASLDARVLQTK